MSGPDVTTISVFSCQCVSVLFPASKLGVEMTKIEDSRVNDE